MYNMMGALRGCPAVKFDSCNNLLSSVHTILVIILQYVRLNIKNENTIIIIIIIVIIITRMHQSQNVSESLIRLNMLCYCSIHTL